MSDFLEPIGNEEAILQNILGANNELLPPISRNEKILLDILGEDYPIEPPMSRIEALLIALKEKIEHDTPSGKINITENGTDINIAQYATADVNVSSADLGTKSITANGTYAASADNLDGYDEVTVAVPMPEEYCIGGSLADSTLEEYVFSPNYTANRLNIYSMFSGCRSLKRVRNFPSSLTSLTNGLTFRDCGELVDIGGELPDNITEITNLVFGECKKLVLTKLPSALTKIGGSAFYNCILMTFNEMPAGVTLIDNQAFSNCASITSMAFKGTPTTIYQNAFYNCTNLLNIYVPWSEGTVANAPWGAVNATIHYDWTGV